MQEYRVVYSELAKNDLIAIYKYVSDISSEYDAKKVINQIINKMSTFDRIPERTEPFNKSIDGNFLRSTIAGKYRIIYIVKQNASEVLIARIFSVGKNLSDENYSLD